MRAIGLLLLAGCIPVVPHYESHIPGRQNVEKALDGGFPTRGATTREEILLRLGEPDNAPERDDVFFYRWSKVVAVFLAGQGSSDSIPAGYSLTLRFDAQGILSSVEMR
jgi:hypothetical protein